MRILRHAPTASLQTKTSRGPEQWCNVGASRNLESSITTWHTRDEKLPFKAGGGEEGGNKMPLKKRANPISYFIVPPPPWHTDEKNESSLCKVITM